MIGDRRVIGIIPARAGSRRMIGKNTRMLAGRPMIGWTLAAARASQVLDRIVVSSDDPAVLDLATRMGCPAPFVRPAALSGPEASVIDAVEHALGEVGGVWDYVVLLQPTSPSTSPMTTTVPPDIPAPQRRPAEPRTMRFPPPMRAPTSAPADPCRTMRPDAIA